MLTFHFDGWFQCRLATNPDPTDDPRGFSGSTIALPGEPDLDRVIRFHNPVELRYPFTEDEFGVFVRRVTIDDPNGPNKQRELPGHPLLNAPVELLGDPKYVQQNLVVVTEPFATPIDPFHIHIEKDGIVLSRKDVFDLANPEMSVRQASEISEAKIMRRVNTTMKSYSPRVAEATGILDAAAYRENRQKELESLLETTTDPLERLRLETRIEFIKLDKIAGGYALAANLFLSTICDYSFEINGPREYIQVENPNNALKGSVGTTPNWPLTFWMGGFDTDTMCAFVRGHVSVPFIPD